VGKGGGWRRGERLHAAAQRGCDVAERRGGHVPGGEHRDGESDSAVVGNKKVIRRRLEGN
jgi:hypothetical protein